MKNKPKLLRFQKKILRSIGKYRKVFVTGPRGIGLTYGVLYSALRTAADNNGARVLIVAGHDYTIDAAVSHLTQISIEHNIPCYATLKRERRTGFANGSIIYWKVYDKDRLLGMEDFDLICFDAFSIAKERFALIAETLKLKLKFKKDSVSRRPTLLMSVNAGSFDIKDSDYINKRYILKEGDDPMIKVIKASFWEHRYFSLWDKIRMFLGFSRKGL